ncbi:MAG TPA: methyl-accepting chemotaxis protein [Pseudomonas sp.]|nr:methyl-accepting chemotaxis protein [Pseudomonas sp.]
MQNNQPPVTEHEYELRDDQNLLSRTDLKGRITYAAPGFIEASGYSQEELIGAPHNIVRHPDMPPQAFANFWDTIRRGEIWSGLVKNRRKNGDYYWVRANVTPIIENGQLQGYSSVRVKVSPPERAEAERIYARIRAGNTRGIRLERGQIVHTGLLGRLRQINCASLKVRLNGMVGLNLLLLLACASLSVFGYRQASESIHQLQQLASDSSGAGLLVALQDQQQNLLTAQLTLMLLVGGLMLGTGSLVLRSFLRQLREAIGFSMQIATGNLAATPPRVPGSEIGRLLEVLSIMRNSLGNIVTDVYRCLDAVGPAAESIAGGNMDLSARTEQQASALQQTASSMEQITTTVQQNAENARQACTLSSAAADEVRSTGTTMGEVVSSMARISSSSEQIAQIIQVIDSIAFQTNILALNATVEAAHAGEHGRGFAVVASEVRHLASRSAEAAQDIRRLIDLSRQEVQTGEAHVQRAAGAIQGVARTVLQVNDIVGEITVASDEQAHGIEQVNQAVAQLDEVTHRNAELVQQSARDAADLDAQVAQLLNVISVLRTGGRGREQIATPQTTVATASLPVRARPTAAGPQPTHRPLAHDEWLAF